MLELKRALLVGMFTSAALLGGGAIATADQATPAGFTSSTDVQVVGTEAIAKRSFVVQVKCTLVKYGHGNVRYIYGTGKGHDVHTARGNAQRNADKSVPPGHYKRHCKPISIKRTG